MMNGMSTRPGGGDGYDSGRGRMPVTNGQPIAPTGKGLLDGYRKDIMNGFEPERPRFNPLTMNPAASPGLAPVDLNDPIQVHLLTETALTDSKGYEILSQDEVDELKKQIQSLTMRIEQARANLAIQSKYRDAASSMAKLYSPQKPEGGAKRRSLRGTSNASNHHLSEEAAREAEMEKLASERRCEELAAELFTLEKRLMDCERQLLEHTAGILQLTHRASSKRNGQQLAEGQQLMLNNGMPGSPESLYTYTNARNSMEPSGDAYSFDERSLYLPLDDMDGQPGGRPKNMIEIPMKSPVRGQHTQLREEMERLREDNARLAEAEAQRSAEAEGLRIQSAGHIRTITDTERRLETLNNKLREVITAFNPAKNGGFSKPEPATGSGISLTKQLDYLERGLATAAEEQSSQAGTKSTREIELDAAAAAATASLAQAEERILSLNDQIQNLLLQSSADLPPPPQLSDGKAIDDQLDYLQDALEAVQSELSRAAEVSSSASANRQNNEQVEAVLTGLWDIIQTGLAEIQQQKAARRQKRLEMGLPGGDDDDDGAVSDSEGVVSLDEPYSLQAFSTKVQWLYAQATSLKEQKSVLQRQIKQQRELNSRSDSEKDAELQKRMDELEKTRTMLVQSEQQAQEAQDQLAAILTEMDTLQKTSAANESASLRGVQDQLQAAQDQIKQRNEMIAALESSNQDVQNQLAMATANLATLQTQLGAATERAREGQGEAERLQGEMERKDAELEEMNMMVIELKTEMTIAKAELDGAYGSRAQRAKEAAALSNSSEMNQLNTQVERLKTELASTLKDLEAITRESITAEKEKLELESRLDDATAAKERLESELTALRDKLEREISRLQEQLDGERLRPPPSPMAGGGGRAGASMLSEQFRATMKEERKKFQEELRVSHFFFSFSPWAFEKKGGGRWIMLIQ
ncbi:putative involucrin repeat protein [Diplogelasinospora grovesii]|uniref:Involucrin repeat protein n=1 Tax=Diplogelasinospora grovesii TaxID=303347 RepID=A0AAN6NGS3_9PEZI|nr:putative involucrin repeat protein [Diplogelasinospora grovesii]